MQYDENAEKYGYEGEMTPLKCDELKVYRTHTDNLGDNYIDAEFVDVVLKEDVDAVIAELKTALNEAEEARYEAGADAADYYQENRKLKRALWLARAERAEAEHAHWATIWFCNTKICLNINKSSVSQDPYKSNTFRNASEWRNMWFDMARKCRAKAEEYK